MRRLELFDLVNYGLLLIIGLACIYPLAHVLSVSLSSTDAIVQGITWYPRAIDLISYKWMLTDPRMMRGYANTILYTTVGTMVNVGMTAITAYPLSKRRLIGRTPITFMMVFTLYFTGGLIPTFLLVRNLGMLNTMWALILPTAVAVWNLIIMRTFFQSLPEELEEAAVIDGAGVLRTLTRIVLPLSKAALAAIGLFYAVGHWNSYFAPIVYLRDIDKMPLQIIVRDMVLRTGREGASMLQSRGRIGQDNPFREELADVSVMLMQDKLKWTALFVSIVPMLLAYPFIQKYFAKGVMIGALKD